MLDAILRTYPGVPDGGPAAVLDYVNRHLFTRRIDSFPKHKKKGSDLLSRSIAV